MLTLNVKLVTFSCVEVICEHVQDDSIKDFYLLEARFKSALNAPLTPHKLISLLEFSAHNGEIKGAGNSR